MSTERTLALRHVARTPLVQAMGVLWLIAAAKLFERLPEGVLHIKWPIGVGLAAGTALLLLATQRWLQLAAVPALLGLLCTLAFSHQLQVDTLVGFGTVAAAYALLLWQLTSSALAHPASGPLARRLRVAGGHGARGGRALLEAAAHWSGFAIAIAVLLLAPVAFLVRAWLAPAEPAPWPMLLLAGAFFLLTGWRYGLRAHAYAFLVCVLLGVWLACALVAAGTSPQALIAGPGIALWTVGLSAVLSSIALAIDRAGTSQTVARVRSVYRAPLRAFALGLAVMAIGQQLAAGGDAPSAVVVLLAGGAILYADHARPGFLWSFAGGLVAWISLHSIGVELLASGEPALNAAGRTHETLVLAALALAMASAARALRRHDRLGPRYAAPLHLNAAIAFATAATVAGPALVGPALGDPALTVALALLVAGAVPLLAPLSRAAAWRGIAVPVLLSALVASALAGLELDLAGAAHAAIAWGFALWLGGNLLVGRWNRRVPAWSIGEAPWPWLGLLSVMAGAAVLASDPNSLWLGFAAASAYLYLLVRNSASPVFPWLAGGALTATGLALCGWWTAPLEAGRWQPITAGAMLASVASLNLVLAAIPAWRRCGPWLSERLGLQRRDLDRPLPVFAGLGLFVTLGALTALAGAWLVGMTAPFEADASGLAVPGLGLALAASFAHANAAAPHRAFAHGLLLSLLTVVVATQMLIGDPRHVPAAIALCAMALLALQRVRLRSPSPGGFARPIDAALTSWLAALPVLAAALALAYPPLAIGDRLAVLALVLVNAAAIGWWQQNRSWLAAAVGLLLALEHALWLIWLPAYELDRSLPWTALASAVNVALAIWLVGRLGRAVDSDAIADDPSRHGALHTLRDVLSKALPAIVGLAVLELAAHGLWVAATIAAGVEPRWLSGGDSIASLSAWAVLAAVSVRTAYRRQEGRWIYAAALLAGAGALYLRVVTFGLAAPGILDTAALVGAAYVLFALQRVIVSTPVVAVPVMHVCMVLPLLALATLPAQLGSAHAGGALMAIAVLYLLIRARTRNPLPLYLGVLALNASAYLWVPLWADDLGMFQLYVLPAAVSVLVVLHLHRRELRPSVLNGARLAALVTLYCGAAVDVFVHPGLAMFALALGLSGASVVIGIALRIRAFLYAGVAFLVLNVGFQLVQLYPEQRLGRAILLIVLGITITGAMIGFNIKREAILQRIRIMRADLDSWE